MARQKAKFACNLGLKWQIQDSAQRRSWAFYCAVNL